MNDDISQKVIPTEGQVTLPIIEYHKLLQSATKLDIVISEKEKDFQNKINEKEKELIEEQKKYIKLQEKIKKGLKIISDTISQLNIHGEKDTKKAGMLQEAILDGVDSVIDEFDESNNES